MPSMKAMALVSKSNKHSVSRLKPRYTRTFFSRDANNRAIARGTGLWAVCLGESEWSSHVDEINKYLLRSFRDALFQSAYGIAKGHFE